MIQLNRKEGMAQRWVQKLHYGTNDSNNKNVYKNNQPNGYSHDRSEKHVWVSQYGVCGHSVIQGYVLRSEEKAKALKRVV